MSETTAFLGGFQTTGFTMRERSPERDQLYASPEELLELFGVEATEREIRYAMSLMNSHIQRPSLWPEEYTERRNLPSDRLQTVLSARPVLKLLEAQGRYSYGRRDRRTLNQVNYDYLAAIAVFGSPPLPTAIDVDQIEMNPATGEIWMPTGFFLIGYSQVDIRYLTGFVEMPNTIKATLATLIHEVCQKGVSDRLQYGVGRVTRRYAGDTFISKQVANMLDPFVVRSLF